MVPSITTYLIRQISRASTDFRRNASPPDVSSPTICRSDKSSDAERVTSVLGFQRMYLPHQSNMDSNADITRNASPLTCHPTWRKLVRRCSVSKPVSKAMEHTGVQCCNQTKVEPQPVSIYLGRFPTRATPQEATHTLVRQDKGGVGPRIADPAGRYRMHTLEQKQPNAYTKQP
jgi:hypothetical protein